MKHFAHYLIREINGWKKSSEPFYSQLQNPDDGFDKPKFHITTRKSGPVTAIEKGSTIWLFSVLKSSSITLPPSLDAKIIVEKVEVCGEKTKFYASEDSKWFPLSDATKVIQNLYTIDKHNKENKLWADHNKPIGFYLQSIRQLSNYNKILEYSEFVNNSEFEFISYRIKDGTKPAFIATQNLIKNGSIIFWDRYNLPRRLVERREHLSDEKLDEYLTKMINNASKVYGIETPMYAEQGCYSLKEAELAKQLFKYNTMK